MRRGLWILAVVGMAAGCGGTKPVSPSPPPPPPSQAGAPVSLVVQVGDNQAAEPGAVVAVKPVVLVKDAAGRGVGGVVVSFAVDSGGGSLTASSATSDASGTASPGDWTLGSSEGRNVVSVLAGNLSARVVANARYSTAEVANQTIAAGGGAIALGGAGPLSGFRLTVPSGAFTAGVNVRVSYGSAQGVPHDTLARIASPLITIESDAPGLAQKLLTIRIPAKIELGEFPLVTFVDPATGFLSALPTIDFDANGVTAEAPALTDRPVVPLGLPLGVIRATGGLPPGSVTSQARVVVQAVKFNINLLPTVTGFRPGADDWEFPTLTTAIGLTGLGQVASERYYYLNRRSSEGPLWARFQNASGVPTSNSAGIYWTAGLHEALEPTLQQHFNASVAQHTANPAKHDSLTLRNIVLSMLFSKGEPQVVVLLDPATQRMYPALVYGYSGPLGQQLLVADPERPGDPTVRLSFNNGSPYCVSDPVPCVLTVGLNYISSGLDPQWPSVLNETMYKANFPPAVIGRTLAGTGAGVPAAPGVVDTIFFSRDTGTVYTLIPSWPYQLPTGLANPASVLITQAWFENSPGGSWSASTFGSSNNMEFLDAVNLQMSPTNPGVDRLFGVEPRVVWPPPTSVAEGWNGFKLYRLLKFVPKLTAVYAAPGQTTHFTLSTGGGPPLPANYDYHYDFGDGQGLSYNGLLTSESHDYSDNLTRTARLAIVHPVTGDTVARASVQLTGNADFFFPQDTVAGIPGTPVTLTLKNRNSPTPKPIRYDWSFSHVGGPQTASVEADSVVQHTWNELGIFAALVTVRDSVTNQILGQDTVQVKVGYTAWKFTSVNVQFTTIETIVGYANQLEKAVSFAAWKQDSAMLVRLASGQNEGGLLHFDKQYTFPFPQFAPFQTNPGIYLLEGTNITWARLSTHLDIKPIGLSGVPPAAGRITNQWLVFGNYQYQQGPTTDGDYLVGYSEVGSLTNGSITGTTWWTTQATIGNTSYFPKNLVQATINFIGNTATGTLTYLFRVWQGGTKCNGAGSACKEAIRAVGTLTFSAQWVP